MSETNKKEICLPCGHNFVVGDYPCRNNFCNDCDLKFSFSSDMKSITVERDYMNLYIRLMTTLNITFITSVFIAMPVYYLLRFYKTGIEPVFNNKDANFYDIIYSGGILFYYFDLFFIFISIMIFLWVNFESKKISLD